MTVTLVITTGLKWSITLGIVGGLLIQVANAFKDHRPFACFVSALTGLGMLLTSMWLFLVWVWGL